MGTEREFDAIFYDLGGTLRLVERDAAFEAEARRKIAEMCGEKGDPDEFCKFLDYRYAGYRKWCFETMREAPEEELWTKRHNFELEESGFTVLCLDYKMAGVGSNSCGPALATKYCIQLPEVKGKLNITIQQV